MSTIDRKLSAETLRKIVFAEMNVSDYRTRVFKELLDELDGKAGKSEETTTKASKGKKAEAAEEMEEVESPYKEEPKKGKGKSAPAKEEVAEEAPAEEDDMFGDEAEESNEPTLDDVRKVVKDFATKHGKEKALKLLGKFKVTSIPDIKQADYAKVIELAKKHL